MPVVGVGHVHCGSGEQTGRIQCVRILQEAHARVTIGQPRQLSHERVESSPKHAGAVREQTALVTLLCRPMSSRWVNGPTTLFLKRLRLND